MGAMSRRTPLNHAADFIFITAWFQGPTVCVLKFLIFDYALFFFAFPHHCQSRLLFSVIQCRDSICGSYLRIRVQEKFANEARHPSLHGMCQNVGSEGRDDFVTHEEIEGAFVTFQKDADQIYHGIYLDWKKLGSSGEFSASFDWAKRPTAFGGASMPRPAVQSVDSSYANLSLHGALIRTLVIMCHRLSHILRVSACLSYGAAGCFRFCRWGRS